MHGANEARQSHLLEFVVDEVADGVGEGEAGRSGGQGGPVYVDGHLHGFFGVFGGGTRRKRIKRSGLRAYLRWRISGQWALCFVDDSSCVLGYYSGLWRILST